MIDEPMRVVLEMIDAVMKKTDAMSGATDTLPPLMSNLKIEEKTDDPPGRRQEEDEGSRILANFVKESCDTEEERHRAMKSICRLFASLQSGAPRNREEFEASIPENPDDWTQEMLDYLYEKEQENMRNFAKQQVGIWLCRSRSRSMSRSDWTENFEEDGKLRRRGVKEKERAQVAWLEYV
ncbi:unnamed protein product [Prunus armeniaca]|uniref:Uncharacterized protein n=1 Tax=Prunus armeniaca TaxID=36596 RepID=A0A6J5Y7F8_PRUAR|nr:unnamed protein product [Prunus armeniaca]